MKRKVVTGITLVVAGITLMLFIGMLTLVFDVQSVKASGTIYIRADGSVDPPTANITSVENVIYTFTGNIVNNSIVVERDNIVVDGAGYTVQGTGSGYGIDLSYRSNVTIKNTQIKAFQSGIYLYQSHNNIISGNNITNNQYGYLGSSSSNYNIISGNSITENNGIGIASTTASHNIFSGNNIANNDNGIMLWSPSNSSVSGNNITANNWKGIYLSSGSYNIVSGNTVTNNTQGIYLSSGSYNIVSGNTVTNNTQGIYLDSYPNNNTIYHNNLVNNTNQVHLYNSVNVWDNDYPSGGNYWSDYIGVDLYSGLYQNETGGDGIGDAPYVIDANNTDHYPLMNPWSDTMPPMISILSPQNTTYPTSSVPLTFTVNEAASWIGYSLDNQANVTIAGNTTLTGLALGPHNVIVYANDTYGNMGSSDKIYFTRIVNDVAILNVTASPTETYVSQIVNINVTVENKGTVSETFNVTAYYDSNAIDTQTVVNLAPDSNITITFSWNTSGVQKGTYTISAEAEVVPGETNTTDNTYIDNTVTILNRAPTIDSFTPVDTTPEVNEGDSLEFTHTSSDPDSDPLTYSWLLDSVEQSTSQNWTYSPDYDDAGTYNVTLVVSDGELTDSQEWSVTVVDVNRPPTIDSYYPSTNPTIKEGESQEFNVTYSDPDGDFTTVQWYLNGTPTVTADYYTFIADYASTGVYNVTVVVSDGPSQTSHQWMLTVTNVERDIAITNVTPSKNIVGKGYSISINVTITNQGDLTETFNVTTYANTTIIQTKNVTLTSGNYTTISFTWNTSAFAKGLYSITANATVVPYETDTGDNTKVDGTVRINMVGDVAPEYGLVDIVDIVYVAIHFGAEKGQPEYEPNADINGDGIIDIVDIVIIAIHFGEVDP